MTNTLDDIRLVTEPAATFLNQRQTVDYRAEREACLKWLLALGKNPSEGEGYAHGTVKTRAARMDRFYRWVWEQEDGYTVAVTHDHADTWMKELAYENYSSAHKNNCLKALRMLFKWRAYERGGDEWESEMTFSQETRQPRDFFTPQERRAIKQAALEYGSVPHYKSLSAAQRDKWKAHLAQRFEMPKAEVGPAEFKRANGWKIPSLVWTSMDAGFRPIEVKRSRVQWIDLDNELLRIPKAESSKTQGNWQVSLTAKTVEYLQRWLDEREQYEKYDDRDAIWLTREGNPYAKTSLRYLYRRLAEEAGIDLDGRTISGYTVRHSTGTYLTDEAGDLKTTATQLRQKSIRSAEKYAHSPAEQRQKHLEKLE